MRDPNAKVTFNRALIERMKARRHQPHPSSPSSESTVELLTYERERREKAERALEDERAKTRKWMKYAFDLLDALKQALRATYTKHRPWYCPKSVWPECPRDLLDKRDDYDLLMNVARRQDFPSED